MELTEMTFGQVISEAMSRQGVTGADLARRAGVSHPTLTRILQGRGVPKWDTVQRLALALGVDLDALRDPALTLPEPQPTPPRGRPRKATVAAE